MGREVPFDENYRCDECGAVGAFDFMGDLLCHSCADAAINNELSPADDDEDDCFGCQDFWDAQSRVEALEWLVEVQTFWFTFSEPWGPRKAYYSNAYKELHQIWKAAMSAAKVN